MNNYTKTEMKFIKNENKNHISFLVLNEISTEILSDFKNEADLDSLLFDYYRRDQVHFLKKLIDAGANINARDLFGHTPLIICFLHDSYDCAKLLIESGADVNLKDNYGDTIFDVVKKNKFRIDQKMVDLLKET